MFDKSQYVVLSKLIPLFTTQMVIFFVNLVQVPYVLVENSGRCNLNSEGEKVC